jgi:acyl transferase domain-containing protein/thioesterase domain-containing protein
LEDVHEFDAAFFGISRREASAMDPAQRLLLETSWEAIERACIAPRALSGTRTGVFAGLGAGDYANLRLASEAQSAIDSYTASGTSASVAAGRLAYILGLHGPCVSIDTACSSSLSAIYLAVQSLRLRECDAALAGGVNLALSPFSTVALSQMRMLSPTDTCRAFDAAADGFVRGEGCVMFLLKRLPAAVEAGDPILAVIRGAAMNHDGRSAGLTAPNGPAQEAVIRRALGDAGCAPDGIDWVETHGTGTQLGDPIEAQALGNVFAEGHTAADPLWISAVKSNIGHLEAGGGAAGLLKAALSVQHGCVPASLHVREPNPLIAWDRIPVRVATRLTGLRDRGRPRRAGVSSFGFSGTNVHLIVEQTPPVAAVEEVAGESVLPVSARTSAALREQVARWAEHLERTTDSLPALCRTASVGRNAFKERVTFRADSREGMAAAMRQWSVTGDEPPRATPGPRAPLPTYPFSRERHWFSLDGTIEFRLDPARMPLLADHQIGGAIVVPAAALISLVFEAAARWKGEAASTLRGIAIASPLRLAHDEVRIVQVAFRESGEWELASVFLDRTELHAAGEGDWTPRTVAMPPTEDGEPVTPEAFYRGLGMDLMKDAGVLGPTFRWMRSVTRGSEWVSAEIHSAAEACRRATPSLSPALLATDAAFQLVAGEAGKPGLYLPFTIDEVRLLRPGAIPATARVRRADRSGWLADAAGQPIVELRGITLREVGAPRTATNLLHRIVWREETSPPQATGEIVHHSGDVVEFAMLLRRLATAGAPARVRLESPNAMLAAVARVAAREHPEIDIVPKPPTPTLTPLTAIDSFVPRPAACYWITGGFGALGRHTARWLVARGARYLALTGRRVDVDFVEELEALGAVVLALEWDVADPELPPLPKLAGVFHAAGVLEDALLVKSTEEQFRRVLAPKVEGARNLIRLLESRELDFLVFFSSISVWTAPPGQAAYAAANAFLDTAAEARNARGLRTLSVNLGPWEGSGMATRSPETERLMRRAGIRPMPPERALSALGAAIVSSHANLVLADIQPVAAETAPAPTASIRDRVAHLLQLDPAALDLDRPLPELGVDSLIALELKQKVEHGLARKLPLQDYLSGLTTRQLIERLEQTAAPESPFLDLSPPRRTVFFFPGAVGSPIYFRAVAEHLGADVEVAGVDALGQFADAHDFPALADACAAAIRSHQTRGPYRLAGHSFGGYLAIEVGRRLDAELVVLIDTAVLTGRADTSADGTAYVARVLRYLNGLPEGDEMPPGYDSAEMVRRARFAFDSMGGYRLDRYEGRVTLFRASEPFPAAYLGVQNPPVEWSDPDLGWRAWLPNLTTVAVPGNHLTIIREPHVASLAQAMRKAIGE